MMGPDLSHVTSPRLLIVEHNFSLLESLIHTFVHGGLDLDYDLCSSHDYAVTKPFHSPQPYQLIISNVHLAGTDDFLLLKQSRTLQPFVPFVVTASASEKESARRVLEQGAFDLITYPLEDEQTLSTVRLALWQGKLRDLIARKEAALDKYHQHLADFPHSREEMEDSFHRTLSAFEKTICSVYRSILQIEKSAVSFSDLATRVEYYAKKRALERLDTLVN